MSNSKAMNNNCEMVLEVTEDQLERPGIGGYTSYGLAMYKIGGNHRLLSEQISDICTNKAKVSMLANLFVTCGLSTLHLEDVVEDFVQGGALGYLS